MSACPDAILDTPLSERWTKLACDAPPDAWPIKTGTPDDYAQLAEHHYRARRPATISRVLVVRDDTPTATDRFLCRASAERPIAVLVESLPTLSCAARDAALNHRYGPPLSQAQRGDLVNRELRCISRVVVHPIFRGVGLAVRLVRHALATAQTPFTEAIAAMGRVHPFFERAGMTRYDRPVRDSEARVLDALRIVGLTPEVLIDRDTAWRRLRAQPRSRQRTVDAELYRFHAGVRGRRRSRRDVTPRARFDFAVERLAFQPLYFLHDNRPSSDA
ncbi:MAG: hypothetical protein AAGB29_02860 [Planctomycetota bacterium]